MVYTLFVCDAGQKPQSLRLPGDALLPGMQQLRLTARTFFDHAGTQIGWTDLSALTALERFYRSSGIPFRVDRAFSARRVLSPHGSGVSFDLGRTLPETQKRRLRNEAIGCGLFARVLPESICPDCVHVDCLSRGSLRAGDRGVFVFVLQQVLQRDGWFPYVCSGEYCRETERAVQRLQMAEELYPTGIADVNVWTALLQTEKKERR